MEGGYVLEPISGVFNNVAIYDFSSLYPEIIRQFNLSYETVSEIQKPGYLDLKNGYYVDLEHRGLLPEVVDNLMFMKNDIKMIIDNMMIIFLGFDMKSTNLFPVFS